MERSPNKPQKEEIEKVLKGLGEMYNTPAGNLLFGLVTISKQLVDSGEMTVNGAASFLADSARRIGEWIEAGEF